MGSEYSVFWTWVCGLVGIVLLVHGFYMDYKENKHGTEDVEGGTGDHRFTG
jgi:hypothetical protein